MGRPDPYVLFAQSFVHSNLDEYVDEVIFAEPVLITACEFLEQNASPCVSTVSLIGATSPPSFALEVFVQCEGEPRFRRLCPAFLYSHSSSNLLEVEDVVTNHLVVRGSYRCLTLVVYGNTAADLGQFNIDLDLDNPLVNLVTSPSEEKLEDLPPALYSTHFIFGESDSTLVSLSLPQPELDLPKEIKEFLHLALRICQTSIQEEAYFKVVNYVVSAISSHINSGGNGVMGDWNPIKIENLDIARDQKHAVNVLSQAKIELLELYKNHQSDLDRDKIKSTEEEFLEFENLTSKELVSTFIQWSEFRKNIPVFEHVLMKKQVLHMGIVLLLCSSRESCFRFITGGGMEQIIHILCHEAQRSTATVLMSLAVIENATRHAIGCEGFLGWWPREDENVPVGNSEGYNHLLSLLLQKPRDDVASLATYILHRLRLYEIVSKYECSVLSVLGHLADDGCGVVDLQDSLLIAKSLLKTVSELIKFSGRVESSPLPFAQASIADQADVLSYKATVDFITSSKYSFGAPGIDTHLLFLLKERGFFPLSAALLSCPTLRSASDHTMDIFVDISASIESILLSLLQCRSGLTFLLLQPETMATLILSLKGMEEVDKINCLTLRDATIFVSKGYLCPPEEIGMIMELHLRMAHAIDRLLATSNHSEEQLWLLWGISAISRSDSGRQALLVIGHFPEAISILIEALRSFKEREQMGADSGENSSLNLVGFHCAAEIFEVLVTDPAASSLSSWVKHAVELHKVLHSSSPRSSRKDAPIRLLEWIAAGVVYHKNGATGLLRYASVLASGGDAHLNSATVLVSDSMDVEIVIGDSTNSSDSQVIDNLLGKLVSDKHFDGIILCSTSIVQLTTAFRILAFISEKSAVAASLYEEGAVTLIYVVLVNCKIMLEQSSNNYDYLVDEGGECNTTSDLLLERSYQQSLVDLMVPSLVLLINLLQKLKETKVQYRNAKLLNALVNLHREICLRVASCAVDLSLPYPRLILGLHAVCRLLVSSLTCWPIFGWTPGLFLCILGNAQPTSLLKLGPKDGCSLLCLLADLFPEEGIRLWKKGKPALSTLRSMSIGIILGNKGESYVDWYLQPNYQTLLLERLRQQLDKIAQIVLHFSISALDVVQDMLRVFIARLACQTAEFAIEVLHPIVSWMHSHLVENFLSDIDVFKVYRLLNFVAILLEHSKTEALLLKVGIYGVLVKALGRSCEVASLDGKNVSDSTFKKKIATSTISWTLPIFKSLCMIFCSQTLTNNASLLHEQNNENLSRDDTSMVSCQLLKLCQFLPVGKELLACLLALKEMVSSSLGRNGLASIFKHITSSSEGMVEQDTKNNSDCADDYDWRWSPPLINCWRKLLMSFECKDGTSLFPLAAVQALCSVALCFCVEHNSSEEFKTLKFLFGLPYDPSVEDEAAILKEKLKDINGMIALLDQMISGLDISASSDTKAILYQVRESVVKLLQQLQRPLFLPAKNDDVVNSTSEEIKKPLSVPSTVSMICDAGVPSLTNIWKAIGDAEQAEDIFLESLSEKFVWDCPVSSSDRPTTPSLLMKRKHSSSEGSNRRSRDNTVFEAVASNAFSRGLGAPNTSSGSARRDTFRQRKPNTSRPPSMHVDDYVARERNVEGVSSSGNVVGLSQRGSGRPPSIHVDEFMARQKERQNPMAGIVTEVAQVKNAPLENGRAPDKSDTPQLLKSNLEDDLQEIDIVFDDESESDDKLQFPPSDDNLQPASIIAGASSPGSIVEESEGSQSGFLSGGSVSRSEAELVHDVNISLEKNHHRTNIKKFFHEQSDESKYTSPGRGSKRPDDLPTINTTAFPPNSYITAPSMQPIGDFRLSNLYLRDSQKPPNVSSTSGSRGYYEPKISTNQPPLPWVPSPTISAVSSQTIEAVQHHQAPCVRSSRDVHPPLPTGFPSQAYDSNIKSETVFSGNSNYMTSLATQPIMDPKYSWSTGSSGSRLHETYTSGSMSAHPPPPLPPTPPPFPAAFMSQSSVMNAGSHSTFSSSQFPLHSPSLNDPRLGQFSNPRGNPSLTMSPFTPSLHLARPASGPVNLIGSSMQQQQQLVSLSGFSPQIPSPSPSIKPIQTQVPPPPHLPRPSHLSQPLRQTLQVSQPQTEQMVSLQQKTIQVHSLQVPQQIPIPQLPVYYKAQQDSLSHVSQPVNESTQSQNPHGQTDNVSQQHEDLQRYFASPESIQSLLSDRNKLCELLEQHPKLMQMLQEKLGWI